MPWEGERLHTFVTYTLTSGVPAWLRRAPSVVAGVPDPGVHHNAGLGAHFKPRLV